MTPQQPLTKRWTNIELDRFGFDRGPLQYWNSTARFNIVPAGRRSFKTEISKRRLVRKAMLGSIHPSGQYGAAAPTREQAKRIYWECLKGLVPDWMKAGPPRESDLRIQLVNGGSIWVVGLDKPQRIEGTPWDHIIIDETADTKATAWGENIRPALADRKGSADIIGVPGGRNHYYDLNEYALHECDPEWAAFHWKTANVLPASEVASLRRAMDEQTFLQECEASFLYFRGRVYYPFAETTHCATLAYDPKKPLIFCFDFNVDPGVAAVLQEQRLPNGEDGTACIGEVWIPRNSNTPAVCRKLIADWQQHQGYVLIYGDATGGNRGSAKVAGSDWDLVKAELKPVFGGRLQMNVPAANPPERVRINAMNTRLKSGDGKIRFMIDPRRAPHVVRDFEGVQLLEGGSGEIDKKRNLELSHISDSCGYYIVKQFPIHDGNQLTTQQARMA